MCLMFLRAGDRSENEGFQNGFAVVGVFRIRIEGESPEEKDVSFICSPFLYVRNF